MHNTHYPQTRLRRLRSNTWIRNLVQEHRVSRHDLIWPVFVTEGQNIREPIPLMPGVERFSIDILLQEIQNAYDEGLQAIALFPVVPDNKKSTGGEEAYNPGNLICRSLQAIKSKVPEIGVICDVALDPYTTHGHDGLIENGVILNDATITVLIKQALAQAEAGADIIAPSDMMDGRIGAIRNALESNNHPGTILLSYAAKYASGFYGPFRDAVKSGEHLKGDKKTYQMNSANADEAVREVAQDIQEGADIVMVKPGLPYLDIAKTIKDTFSIPTFAYQVSGEYAMLKAASDKEFLDYDTSLHETLLSFKRAGCDAILTYAARDMLRILNSKD